MQFSERVTKEYPEVYGGGTKEGAKASGYFEKWGWYSTIKRVAKGKPWRMDFVVNMNVHEFHVWLAEDIDKQNLKADLRAGANTKRL